MCDDCCARVTRYRLSRDVPRAFVRTPSDVAAERTCAEAESATIATHYRSASYDDTKTTDVPDSDSQ